MKKRKESEKSQGFVEAVEDFRVRLLETFSFKTKDWKTVFDGILREQWSNLSNDELIELLCSHEVKIRWKLENHIIEKTEKDKRFTERMESIFGLYFGESERNFTERKVVGMLDRFFSSEWSVSTVFKKMRRTEEARILEHHSERITHLELSGVLVPLDVVLIIFSFFPRNKKLVNSICCVNETWMRALFASWDRITIHSRNQFLIPVEVLKSIIFLSFLRIDNSVDPNDLRMLDLEYCLSKLNPVKIRRIDFSELVQVCIGTRGDERSQKSPSYYVKLPQSVIPFNFVNLTELNLPPRRTNKESICRYHVPRVLDLSNLPRLTRLSCDLLDLSLLRKSWNRLRHLTLFSRNVYPALVTQQSVVNEFGRINKAMKEDPDCPKFQSLETFRFTYHSNRPEYRYYWIIQDGPTPNKENKRLVKEVMKNLQSFLEQLPNAFKDFFLETKRPYGRFLGWLPSTNPLNPYNGFDLSKTKIERFIIHPDKVLIRHLNLPVTAREIAWQLPEDGYLPFSIKMGHWAGTVFSKANLAHFDSKLELLMNRIGDLSFKIPKVSFNLPHDISSIQERKIQRVRARRRPHDAGFKTILKMLAPGIGSVLETVKSPEIMARFERLEINVTFGRKETRIRSGRRHGNVVTEIPLHTVLQVVVDTKNVTYTLSDFYDKKKDSFFKGFTRVLRDTIKEFEKNCCVGYRLVVESKRDLKEKGFLGEEYKLENVKDGSDRDVELRKKFGENFFVFVKKS